MDPAALAAEDGKALQCQYKLSGVVVHSGLSIRDGHYIAYCLGIPDRVADVQAEAESSAQRRSQSGKKPASAESKKSPWFRFDDEVVTRVSLEEVLRSEAYILMYTMVPQGVEIEDDEVPQWVLPAVMHKDTRTAQAPSRIDPDSLSEGNFGWYASEAVGVVVSLWTLLLGLVMYNTRNSVEDSAHIVLNFFSSIENDYVGIMVVPLLLGMVGFLRSISFGLNDGGFSGFVSAVLGYLCGFLFHVACVFALATVFKSEKQSSGDSPSSSTSTVMGRWSSSKPQGGI